MQAIPPIGNDLVALGEPSIHDKANDRRFLDRVLSAQERAQVDRALDPALMLWALWSAKETAYKIARKLQPTAIFAHRRFEVNGTPLLALTRSPDTQTAESWIDCAGKRFPLRWHWRSEYLHCLGADTQDLKVLDQIFFAVKAVEATDLKPQALSDLEQESVHSDSSYQVRLLAKELLKAHGISPAQIIRPPLSEGFGPPEVFKNEKERYHGVELSLSHDGDYLAAAILVLTRK